LAVGELARDHTRARTREGLVIRCGRKAARSACGACGNTRSASNGRLGAIRARRWDIRIAGAKCARGAHIGRLEGGGAREPRGARRTRCGKDGAVARAEKEGPIGRQHDGIWRCKGREGAEADDVGHARARSRERVDRAARDDANALIQCVCDVHAPRRVHLYVGWLRECRCARSAVDKVVGARRARHRRDEPCAARARNAADE
jgi:hypothetical protein